MILGDFPAIGSLLDRCLQLSLPGVPICAQVIALLTIDPAVWQKDWGVHLQPFGTGENVIKYLGRYVCRTAIGDSRIVSISDSHVTFRWKDRAHNNAEKLETLEGVEFVKRYLRHVLPRGLRAIRYYGFCHPAAKVKRERIAFQIGRPLFIGDFGKSVQSATAPLARSSPCCGGTMKIVATIEPPWRAKHRTNRGPPCQPKIQKPKCP